MKITFWSVIGLIIFSSCTGYKVHKYPELADEPYKEDIVVSGEHVDFFGKSGADQLRYAKHLSGEMQYERALAYYQKIYQNKTNETKIRAEALYLIGELYRNVLFQKFDTEKSMNIFQQFLEEFPESKFLPNVNESIVNIHRLMQEE